jgi:hypothetical protein
VGKVTLLDEFTAENAFAVPGPDRIDFVVTGGTIGGLKKGETRASLYKFEGDVLVFGEGAYGATRSTEFKAAEGVYLYKFMRASKE